MSSLQAEYARSLGIIPKERPILNEKFFPVTGGKYIVIHNDGKLPSKLYDYFPEVISLLRPILNKFGYKIHQIGGPNDPKLDNIDSQYLGLSWGQNFHVIKNASLFLGIDSINSHAAAAYEIPSVVLFSHTYPCQVLTSWLPDNKRRILTPDYGGKKPSFSPVEDPKTIRTIKVEDIVNSVFQLLHLDAKLDMQTIRVGKDYHEPVMEIIPDFFAENPALKGGTLHMRMDLFYNDQCLWKWLQEGYRANIITDRPISLDGLKQFRQNINRVTLTADNPESYDLNYVKSVKNIGLDLLMIGTNEQTIANVREKFFDYSVESLDHPERSLVDKVPKDAKFFTKKQIHSGGKIFPSIAHYKKNIPFSKANKILDSEDFWLDIEYYYFYK